MSRGSEIVIGILCLLLSAVFFILAPITGPTAPIGVSGILLSAAVAGMIGISCVTTWGRPMTSRIAAGCLCLAMLALAVGIMFSNKSEVKAIIFAGTIALMSGVYCCSGLYPSWLPLSRVFSHRDTAQFGGGGNVEVDDRGVSYTDPDGQVSTLAWEELQLIGVETTSAGPFLEDVFFLPRRSQYPACNSPIR